MNSHNGSANRVCCYPKCNCPFDMGPEGLCLRGYPRASEQDMADRAQTVDWSKPMDEIKSDLAGAPENSGTKASNLT